MPCYDDGTIPGSSGVAKAIMSQQLPNYLRTYRKRAALTQTDVAFLMGCASGTKVSRHERYMREPSVENVLAYQAIFQASPRKFLAGSYAKVEKEIACRSRTLIRRLETDPDNPVCVRKLETLKRIAGIGKADSANTQTKEV